MLLVLSAVVAGSPTTIEYVTLIIEAVGALALPFALFALVLEARKAARDRADKVVAWAAVPHDREHSAGLRGAVIVNNSEQVARDVEVVLHAGGDAPTRHTYPMIPPGTHFFPVQERVTSGTGEDAAGTAGDRWENPVDYWLLPVDGDKGVLKVSLRHAGDPQSAFREYELMPWTSSAEGTSFRVDEFAFGLGGNRWRRRDGKTIRGSLRWPFGRARSSVEEADAARDRRFPTIALTEKQEAAQTGRSYDDTIALIDAVGRILAGGHTLAPNQTLDASAQLRAVGVSRVRRSKTIKRKEGERGGLALTFFVGDEQSPSYSFGAGQTGTVPAWFVATTANGDVKIGGGLFARRRSVVDWTAADLADAIVSGIRDHSHIDEPTEYAS